MSNMHRLSALFVLLLVAASWSSFLPANDAHQLEPAHAAAGSCIGHERDALLAFKQGIDRDEDYLDSWQPGRQDCCRWKGVTCSNATGHVIKLDLGEENLVGQLRNSLLSLEHLRYLSLSWVSLCTHNTRLEFLGSFSNLRHLELYYISCGSVPPQIGNLSKLEYFAITSTYVSWESDNGPWLTSYETSHG
ncbi:unnamed protein product [Alopecurus aequalis]